MQKHTKITKHMTGSVKNSHTTKLVVTIDNQRQPDYLYTGLIAKNEQKGNEAQVKVIKTID